MKNEELENTRNSTASVLKTGVETAENESLNYPEKKTIQCSGRYIFHVRELRPKVNGVSSESRRRRGESVDRVETPDGEFG